MGKAGLDRVGGVLFDFDGTLTRAGSLDFGAIRDRLGCPGGEPVLEFLENLPSFQRNEGLRILDDFEYEAALNSKPAAGATELVESLCKLGIPVGILSRNSSRSITRALDNFPVSFRQAFQLVFSREAPFSPKPSPEPVLAAASQMGIPVEELLCVGDFVYDIQAAQAAGAQSALLSHEPVQDGDDHGATLVTRSLEDLWEVLSWHLPLPPGKLSNHKLGQILRRLDWDQQLVVAPGVGEDVAVAEIPDRELLVLKSDPITFTPERLGYYAVVVNANDLATCGATPQWFLSTVLFPPGTTASEIRDVLIETSRICQEFGITLCGGHTEVTDAVTRPIICGFASAVLKKEELIDKSKVQPGDVILVSKAIALEGTAILAREFPTRLKRLGVTEAEIDEAGRLLDVPGISVLAEASICAECPGTVALHDVTEGGVSTALEELSHATGFRLEIDQAQIPVNPLTSKFCNLLEIEPFGLIASGSLLMIVRRIYCQQLSNKLVEAGIEVTRIGVVGRAGFGIETKEPWMSFDRDELPRAIEFLSGSIPD